jgi:hypothetical protein
VNDVTSTPVQNRLLAYLPAAEQQRWFLKLERVDMPLGLLMYEAGVTLKYVYFPTTAIVSLLGVMENGASAEIALVGNDGIVGVSLFMGGDSTPSRGLVQSAGKGYRLAAQLMKNEFNKAGPVLDLLLRYTQALITQISKTAVCNRHHSLDQQLCRWLLLTLDRLPGSEIVMTQELIRKHVGRSSRGRNGRCTQITESRTHSVCPRAHHGGRSKTPRESQLRMLCGGKKRIRPAVA